MKCPQCGTQNPEDGRFCMSCGRPLVSVAEGVVVAEAEKSAAPQRPPQKRRLPVGIFVGCGVFLVILCVAVVGGLWLFRQSLGLERYWSFLGRPAADEILVVYPDQDKKYDLYLHKLGDEKSKEGIALAEGVELANFYWSLIEDGRYTRSLPAQGGFIPDSKLVYFAYKDDDEIVFQQYQIGDEEPVEIISTKANLLWGGISRNPEMVYFVVRDEDKSSCYQLMADGQAKRRVRGDRCYLLAGSTNFLVAEMKDGTTTRLDVLDAKTDKKTKIADDLEAISYVVSSPSLHLVYSEQTAKGVQLYEVARPGEEAVALGPRASRIVDFWFYPGSESLLYILDEVERNRGVLRLYRLGESDALAEGVGLRAAFSPDGKHLVYVVEDQDGEQTLSVRLAQGGDATKLLSGEQISFWAYPDLPLLLFQDADSDGNTTLYSAKYDGGRVTKLFEQEGTLDMVYRANSATLYLTTHEADGSVSLFAGPMTGEIETRLLRNWSSIVVNGISPDGQQIILLGREDEKDPVALYSLTLAEDAEPILLDDDLEGVQNLVFAPDNRSILYTVRTGPDSDDFAIRQAKVDGKERYQVLYKHAILADVRWGENLYTVRRLFPQTIEKSKYAARLLFTQGDYGAQEIFSVKEDGNDLLNLTNSSADDHSPVWSPDGQQILFISNRDGNDEIYVMNADGSGLVNLTHHTAADYNASWSPDGRQIVFGSNRDGDDDIYLMNADGSNVRNLTANTSPDWSPTWSPDGQYILFTSQRQENHDLYVVSSQGGSEIQLTASPGNDLWPVWSPDGRFIAYSYDADRNWSQINLYRLEASCIQHPSNCQSSSILLSAATGMNWANGWSRDGSLLLFNIYSNGHNALYRVDADGKETIEIASTDKNNGWGNWSPDGSKIAFTSDRDGDYEIYIIKADGTQLVQVTKNNIYDWSPTWAP